MSSAFSARGVTLTAVLRGAQTAGLFLFLVCAGCGKKASKLERTEPWLAHPVVSAAVNVVAPALRYTLTERSRIDFELRGKRGLVRGTLPRVRGEFSIEPSDLARSHGHVEADLRGLTIAPSDDGTGAILAQAKSALGIGDPLPDDEASNSNRPATASFDFRSLEDVSPSRLESTSELDGGPFGRRVHATAAGDLLLHGFRVRRRAPLEALFEYGVTERAPSTVSIRSRAPLVISLETHEIRVAESGAKARRGLAKGPREAHVSVELYAVKTD